MPAALRPLFTKRAPRWTIAGISVALVVVFSIFDLRSGGMERNFSLAKLADPGWVLDTFGPLWFYGGFVLNVLLAVGSATLMVFTVTAAKSRQATAVCSTSAFAPVALGFGIGTCPGCILPVTGLIGTTVAASSLPLLGLEFKLLAVVLLAAAFAWALRTTPVDADARYEGSAPLPA